MFSIKKNKERILVPIELHSSSLDVDHRVIKVQH